MRGKKKKQTSNQQQLEDIKRLLIALLLKLGATSQEIGLALGVTDAAVRMMLPVKKFAKVQLSQQEGGAVRTQ